MTIEGPTRATLAILYFSEKHWSAFLYFWTLHRKALASIVAAAASADEASLWRVRLAIFLAREGCDREREGEGLRPMLKKLLEVVARLSAQVDSGGWSRRRVLGTVVQQR